jgi:hypothetical protein
MNNSLPSNLIRSTTTSAVRKVLLSAMLAIGTAGSIHAQGQIGNGTIGGSGSGPYTYSLSFGDAAGATSPIGSVWYSWIPGQFFLPGVPTSASAPAGWTANIFSQSVQFVANSAADDIQPGHVLSGFGYQATFSPAQLAAAPNSAESVAYSGALFSDAGNTFNVVVVPEPSTLALVIPGAIGLCLVARRKLRSV